MQQMDDKSWFAKLSPERYGVREMRNQFVPMRDQTRLACDIFRPDTPGRFPAIVSFSPYGKDVQRVMEKQRPHSSRLGNGGQEAGDTRFFVSRGYVHVIADTRGAGDSEGVYQFQGPREQQDGYDLIEWIAAQPWCDGNVGMLGMSYFAVVQLLIATQRPPHLKAIAPFEAYTDRYRHSVYHGGILNEGFFHQWWEHLSIGASKPLIYNYLSANEINSRREDLYKRPEIQESPYLYIQLKYEDKNPLLFDFLIEPHDGPYYWDRSSYPNLDKINVPVLIMNRWSGWPIHLAGAFQAWQGIQSPKKMYIVETEWLSGPKRPWRDHQDIILRWYEHWLKGNDTGMMDESPITLLIRGRDGWRHEWEWPLARTQWTKYWLHSSGLLSLEPPQSASEQSFFNDPFIAPGKVSAGLDFVTRPFEQEVEVTGPLALYLTATLDQPEATWFVNIKNRAPDGSTKVVTKGWLRASHRKLDPARSTPYKPYHPHDESVPVPIGEPVTYAIDIRDTSMAFQKGHQLVVEIRGQDTQAEDPVWYHLCNPIETKHTIHCGGAAPSYLLLPIVPRKS